MSAESAQKPGGLSLLVSPQVQHARQHLTDQVTSEDKLAAQLPRTRLIEIAAESCCEPERYSAHGSHDEEDNPAFPPVGDEFLDFGIVAQIGQGSFAKVYLAKQRELNDRLVVLKVSREKVGEADVLAQLLHTNIVPIFSLHRKGSLYATCMPYLGVTTLADILREVRAQGVPDSGKYLVQTLSAHRSTQKSCLHGSCGRGHSSLDLLGSEPTSLPNSVSAASRPRTRLILDNLETLRYEEAVLWLFRQLADGLRHAHERGILHRDLKPANILWTDEGQPMLLDFNLAEDTKTSQRARSSRLGGTLVYMSPEQLRAFEGVQQELDARSDVFSLGVILFELLTGRFPFPYRKGPLHHSIPKMLQDREARLTHVRQYHPGITPAMEAIVQKCLESDPARRYQSAGQLEEDLKRQLNHRPLKFTRERSLTERVRKWRRRHPRLASLTTLTVLSSAVIALLLAFIHVRGERLRQLEAVQSFDSFDKNFAAVQFLAASPSADRVEVQRLLTSGQQLLLSYGVVTDDDWHTRPLVRCLPAAQRRLLQKDVAMLLLVLARAKAQAAVALPNSNQRQSILRQAVAYSRRAEESGAAKFLPRTLWTQRAELLELIGDNQQASAIVKKARQTPAENVLDKYLLARELLLHRKYNQALALLKEVTGHDPQHAPAWFLQGSCHLQRRESIEAIACFSTAIALQPNMPPLYFQRGLVYLRQRRYAPAQRDFNKVIALDPNDPNAYINRALTWNGLGQTQEAVDDLTTALKLNAPYTRVFFLRARFREALGNSAGAEKDREQGLKRRPTDEKSWIARGVAKLSSDPVGAIVDFDQALKLNPQSLAALADKAHVLAHIQGESEKAVAVYNQLLKFHPNHLTSRTARGLLLAQLGQRQAAHQDAELCLKCNRQPSVIWRVACIYALTSKEAPEDQDKAFRLLKAALKKGYGLDLLERDPHLTPLRDTAEFKHLLTAVHYLQE